MLWGRGYRVDAVELEVKFVGLRVRDLSKKAWLCEAVNPKS